MTRLIKISFHSKTGRLKCQAEDKFIGVFEKLSFQNHGRQWISLQVIRLKL